MDEKEKLSETTEVEDIEKEDGTAAENLSAEPIEAVTEEAAQPEIQPQVQTVQPQNGYAAFRAQNGMPMSHSPVEPRYNPPQQEQQNPYYSPYNQQNYQQPVSAQPYQYQYQPAPDLTKKAIPKKTKSEKKIAMFTWILVAVMMVFFVYCVISDTVIYCMNPNIAETNATTSETVNPDVPDLEQQSKNDIDAYVDSGMDGRYTVEDVALLVGPSIVQIMVYDENSEVISTGSGIILSEDGYILTNAHVVSDGASYEVLDAFDETYTAEIVGYDVKSDIAVICAYGEDFCPAVLGDSNELNVGEAVVAIGNPAGLTNTVTSGIVSANNRQIRNGSTGFYMNCIQTDAAISPGNSGGALVNMYGQVVGVTSSKYTSSYSGTYEGLGFAISINDALPLAEELMANGFIGGRVRIGITFISMELESAQAEFAAQYGLDENEILPKGLWITEIAEDCDIANTRLQPGDILLEMNGIETDNYDELYATIDGCSAGYVFTAKCVRYEKGKEPVSFEIEFKLMEDRSGDY